MRPLPLVSAGLVLVAIDLRVDRFDLLLDPVGWLLVAEGARRLGLRTPAGAAGLAAALSLTDVWLPHHLRRIVTPFGVTEHLVFDPVTGWQLLGMVATAVVGGAALWLLLGGLAGRADGSAARRLEALRWLVPAAWTAPFVVVAAAHRNRFDAVWNDGLEYLALVGIVTLLLVAAQLLASAGRRWAVPPAAPLRSLGRPLA